MNQCRVWTLTYFRLSPSHLCCLPLFAVSFLIHPCFLLTLPSFSVSNLHLFSSGLFRIRQLCQSYSKSVSCYNLLNLLCRSLVASSALFLPTVDAFHVIFTAHAVWPNVPWPYRPSRLLSTDLCILTFSSLLSSDEHERDAGEPDKNSELTLFITCSRERRADETAALAQHRSHKNTHNQPQNKNKTPASPQLRIHTSQWQSTQKNNTSISDTPIRSAVVTYSGLTSIVAELWLGGNF